MSQYPPERVFTYIDGFNLYHGLRAKGWRRYLWLDLAALAARLLVGGQFLKETKYFTARVSGPPDSARRQTTYLDALDAHGGVQRFEGKFQPKTIDCRACGNSFSTHEEKQTDVNIAVEMVRDAHLGLFETALLISADSDLTPPVKAVLATGRRVIVACPPKRYSDVLTKAASGSIPIHRQNLARNLLPDPVITATGYSLRQPTYWK